MIPNPNDDDLDTLLARGGPGPNRADALWQRVTQQQQQQQQQQAAPAWRKWLLLAAPAAVAFAVALIGYERSDTADGFTARGRSEAFAVARCLPRCVPGATLTFELAHTIAGALHVWATLGDDTVWLYPDSSGFAPMVDARKDMQLVSQGVVIPKHWRGDLLLSLVIQPTVDRDRASAAASQGTAGWSTTARLTVEAP